MGKNFKKPAAEFFISAADEQPKAQAETFVIPKGYILAREPKSERMQLLVRPAIKEGIKKLADERGTSVNDLIGQILDEYLERENP